MKTQNYLLIILILIFATVVTGRNDVLQAASVNCDTAKQPFAVAVCSDAELSLLDSLVGEKYKTMRDALTGPLQLELIDNQLNWFSNIRDKCKMPAAAQCLLGLYQKRLESFISDQWHDPKAQYEATLNIETRQQLQQKLVDLDHYQDKVDGRFGPKFRKAVAKAQRKFKLKASGFVNEKLVSKLGIQIVADSREMVSSVTQKSAVEIVIPDAAKSKYPDLIPQILASPSMNNEEKNYWFSVLPIMIDEHIAELRSILDSERKRLAAIEENKSDVTDQVIPVNSPKPSPDATQPLVPLVPVSTSDSGALRQVVQIGHLSTIGDVVFSPDMRLALTRSWNEVKLWEIATGKEIRSKVSNEYGTMYFSKDNKLAILLSGEIWDVAAWKKIRTIDPKIDRDAFGVIDYNSFGIETGYIVPKSSELQKALDKAKDDFNTDYGIYLNSRILYITNFKVNYDQDPGGGVKHSIGIAFYDTASGRLLNKVNTASSYVMAFSPDGNFFVSNEFYYFANAFSYLNYIGIWNARNRKIINTIGYSAFKGKDVVTQNDLVVTQAAISSNNELLLLQMNRHGYQVDGGECSYRLYDMQTKHKRHQFLLPYKSCGITEFSPDNNLIAVGGEDFSVHLFNVNNGRAIRELTGIGTSAVSALAVSIDSKLVVTGSYDWRAGKKGNTMRLWDLTTGRMVRGFSGSSGMPTSMIYSPDGMQVLSKRGQIQCSHAQSGCQIENIYVPRSAVVEMDIELFHEETEGKWDLWDVTTRNYISSFGYANLPEWASSIKSLIQKQKEYKANIAVSPNGNLVFNFNDMKLLDSTTGTTVRTLSATPSNLDYGLATFSPDGNFILTGNIPEVGTLSLWEVATGKKLRTFSGHHNSVGPVALSPDNRLAISGGDDGMTGVWDVASGQEIVKMVSTTDGEWSVNTPDGYYNTSPEGKSAVHYASATETYGFEQFESLFRRPDIIQARLAGDLKAGTPAPKLTRPPRVTLVSTRNLTTTTDKAIYPLAITATSHDDLVQTVRVFVNGKPALEKPVNAKEQRLDFEVPLFAGPNRITTVAYDRKGFSSNQASIDIISTVPGAKKPTLFVMAVGISQYPKMRKGDQLDYAHTDAQNLVKTLRQQKGQLFADVRDFTLTNKEATPRAITDGLHALSAMDANDIAIIFFAGHGVHSKDGRFWYVTQEGSLKQPESGGLDWQTLNEHFNRIKGRVILFLDACHSGSITDETIVPNDQLAAKFFKGGMGGVMVFSASKGRQTSLENETIGGGLFTHFLTQGLTAKETDRDNNGFVEFMELVDYVSKAVNEKTSGQQTPWLSRRELFGDLAVATVQ